MDNLSLADLSDLYIQNLKEGRSIEKSLSEFMQMTKERQLTGNGDGYIKFNSAEEAEADANLEFEEGLIAKKNRLEKRKREINDYLNDLEGEITKRLPREVAYSHKGYSFHIIPTSLSSGSKLLRVVEEING